MGAERAGRMPSKIERKFSQVAQPTEATRATRGAEFKFTEAEQKQQLNHEVEEIGIATLTRKTIEANEAFDTVRSSKNDAGVDNWARNPTNTATFALSTADALRSDFAPNPSSSFKFDIGPEVKAADGVQILELTASTETEFTCKMADGTMRQISRHDVANAQIIAAKTEILTSITNEAQRKVTERYIDALQSNDAVGSMTETEMVQLRDEISASLQSAGQGLRSVDAARDYVNKEIPDPTGIARTLENAGELDRRSRLREEIFAALEGRTLIDFDTWGMIYCHDAPQQAQAMAKRASDLEQAAKKPGLKESERRELEREAVRARHSQSMYEEYSKPGGVDENGEKIGRDAVRENFEALSDGTIDPENAKRAVDAALNNRIDDAIGELYPQLRDNVEHDLETRQRHREQRRTFFRWSKRGGVGAIAMVMALGSLIKAADE